MRLRANAAGGAEDAEKAQRVRKAAVAMVVAVVLQGVTQDEQNGAEVVKNQRIPFFRVSLGVSRRRRGMIGLGWAWRRAARERNAKSGGVTGLVLRGVGRPTVKRRAPTVA
jgi:hypothetical protein